MWGRVLPGQFGGHVQQYASPVLLLQLPYPRCPVSTAAHKPAHTHRARVNKPGFKLTLTGTMSIKRTRHEGQADQTPLCLQFTSSVILSM